MKVFEYFLLHIIFTTSVQSGLTGNGSKVNGIVLQHPVTGEFTLLCKTMKQAGSIRWVLNDKRIALVTRKSSNCSSSEGSDSRFLYRCNDHGFLLTVPKTHVDRKINGSEWTCQDPHGEKETYSITIYVAGSAEEGDMSRNDSMKKWLILISLVAAVLLFATAILAADKLKNKRRGAHVKECSCKRNSEDTAEPTSHKHTGSYRDNSMYTPSDLNNVSDREYAMQLPLLGEENATKQNVYKAMALPSHSTEGSVLLSKQYVDKAKTLAAHNLDKTMTLPRKIIEKEMTLSAQTIDSKKSIPLKNLRECHNGPYCYAEIRDIDLNDIH